MAAEAERSPESCELEQRLARALDPGCLCDDINRSLKLRGSGTRVARCFLDRYRYRPGKRAILSLRLDTAGGSLLAAGTIYPGARARRLAERSLETTVPGSTMPAVLYLAHTGMLLEMLPYDHRLPALGVVMEGRSRVLKRVVGRVAGGAAAGVPACRDLQVVRYRPGISATLKYVPDRDFPSSGAAYVKLFRSSREAACSFRNARALAEGAREHRVPLEIECPRMGIPALAATVTRGAAGAPLAASDQAVDERAPWEQLGLALAALHRSRVRLPARAPRVATMVPKLRKAIHDAEPHFASCLPCAIRPEGVSAYSGPPVPCHLDLKPEHVFRSRDRLALIDADTAAMGEPWSDLSLLLARIALRPDLGIGQWDRGVSAARRVANGYFSGFPYPGDQALQDALLPALLKVALYCVQHRVSDRHRKLSIISAFAANSGLLPDRWK